MEKMQIPPLFKLIWFKRIPPFHAKVPLRTFSRPGSIKYDNAIYSQSSVLGKNYWSKKQVTEGMLMKFLLAIIQGISEIYPVSSAGHLVVFGVVTGTSVSFETLLLLHLGSVVAIALFYRRKFMEIITGPDGQRILLMFLISFLTTAGVGLLLEQFAHELTDRPITVARFWLLNATMLFLFAVIVQPGERDIVDLRFRDFLIIGLAQGFGSLPGISRLGVTLGVALLCRLRWSQAVALSFILSVPVILAASLWQMIDLTFVPVSESPLLLKGWSIAYNGINIPPWSFYPHFLLASLSFISSWFALHNLSKVVYLGRRLLVFFAVYCLVGGIFFPVYLSLYR